MKIAVSASTAGNICTSISISRPIRRPLNRSRLNANAAAAPISRDRNELMVASMTVLRNQIANGHWVLVRTAVKLSSDRLFGIRQVSAARPRRSGGQAAVSVLPPENARLMT